MRWFAWVPLVFALVQALPRQGNLQPDTQVGNFVFQMPPGWRRVNQGKCHISDRSGGEWVERDGYHSEERPPAGH